MTHRDFTYQSARLIEIGDTVLCYTGEEFGPIVDIAYHPDGDYYGPRNISFVDFCSIVMEIQL